MRGDREGLAVALACVVVMAVGSASCSDAEIVAMKAREAAIREKWRQEIAPPGVAYVSSCAVPGGRVWVSSPGGMCFVPDPSAEAPK